MSQTLCRFTPVDSWFFRESRPQGSLGSSELGSVFPPPVSTLLGALRTLIGDAWHAEHGTNWRQLSELPELTALIGDSQQLGELSVLGPYLAIGQERLYPAPATLMVKDDTYFLLDLAPPVRCDLGLVHLPSFPSQVNGLKELAGSKPAEDAWVTHSGWEAILQGKAPSKEQVFSADQLFYEESRLGIARDNRRRGVKHGMLYQTRHLRLHPELSVELVVEGIPPALAKTTQVVRLGGEGRMATLSFEPASSLWPSSPLAAAKESHFMLYYLTPSLCADGLPTGIPASFTEAEQDGVKTWQGVINDKHCQVLSVACQRPLREGGWDLANHQAKPVQSYIAAGTALFCDTPLSLAELQNLHSSQLGTQTEFGRGQFFIGRLPTTSTFRK